MIPNGIFTRIEQDDLARADPSAALAPVAQLIEALSDYRDGGQDVRGKGSRALIQQRIGETSDEPLEWVSMEHSNPVSARWVFQRAVARLYPLALEIAGSDEAKFDANIEIGSRAYGAVERLANDVVKAYFQHVRLCQGLHNPYRVGTLRADSTKVRQFKNALHQGYVGLNSFECEFADALDATGLTWCRNPPRTGFGIPLLSIGQTSKVYPDFLVWKHDDVYALDTTGGHLIKEKTARKLLSIMPPRNAKTRLYVRLISKGKWDEKVNQLTKDGYTVWRLREDRELGLDHVVDLRAAVEACVKDETSSGLYVAG